MADKHFQQRPSRGPIPSGASVLICEYRSLSTGNSPNADSYASSLNESSTITVQLFHVQSPSKATLRATALIPVKNSLPRDHEANGTLHIKGKFENMASYV